MGCSASSNQVGDVDGRELLVSVVQPAVANPAALGWTKASPAEDYAGKAEFGQDWRIKSLTLSSSGLALSIPQLASTMASLVVLDLSGNPSVRGMINVLAGARNLEELRLNGTKVAGKLESLEGLNLRALHLNDTEVSGQLTARLVSMISEIRQIYSDDAVQLRSCGRITLAADLSALGGIERILLNDLNTLEGDIKSFAGLSQLTELAIAQTKLAGQVRVLKDMPKLTCACLRNAKNIEGNFNAFEACHDITILDISGTKIGGMTNGFASLPKLTEVSVGMTNLTGDIKVLFRSCRSLRMLRANDAHELDGDLNTANSCPDLEVLELNATGVRCTSLEWSSSLPKLRVALLNRTDSTGDVSGLANCPLLEHVDLYCTGVGGALDSFAACPELQTLNVSMTALGGSINSLHDLAKLAKLDITKCLEIKGDISDFAVALPACTVEGQTKIEPV